VDGQRAPAAAAATLELPSGTSLLLAEDNAENVVLIEAYLEHLPLKIDVAANGLEALEKRKNGQYSMIFMDIQMPVMDGLTATREIRRWEQQTNTPRVPIVALTAHALNGAYQASLENGCDGHLTKPVERADLLAALGEFGMKPRNRPPSGLERIAQRRPLYVANRSNELEALREALRSEDFEAIRVIGHNCKGTGKGYGFPELSEIGGELEKAARGKDPVGVSEFVMQFDRWVGLAAQRAPPETSPEPVGSSMCEVRR
jgi:CheY-like chemotaxis protein